VRKARVTDRTLQQPEADSNSEVATLNLDGEVDLLIIEFINPHVFVEKRLTNKVRRRGY
jgi:hypothetical protein